MSPISEEVTQRPAPVTFREATLYWLKLGFISFGGPAGQISMMHQELVERRRWISERRFLHALNYTMVLPGPEAQQLATYLGWLLHGTIGGILAGALFVLPILFLAQIAFLVAAGVLIDALIVRAPTWGIEPSSVKEALNAAEIISRIPEQYGKPVIATALRRERSGVVYELMRQRSIPTYEFPEEAARAIYGLYTYSRVLERAN